LAAWGSVPDPAVEAYSAPPDPVAVTRGGEGQKEAKSKERIRDTGA